MDYDDENQLARVTVANQFKQKGVRKERKGVSSYY